MCFYWYFFQMWYLLSFVGLISVFSQLSRCAQQQGEQNWATSSGISLEAFKQIFADLSVWFFHHRCWCVTDTWLKGEYFNPSTHSLCLCQCVCLSKPDTKCIRVWFTFPSSHKPHHSSQLSPQPSVMRTLIFTLPPWNFISIIIGFPYITCNTFQCCLSNRYNLWTLYPASLVQLIYK